MSEIPSDIAGSSLQAGYQQADVAKTRDAERAGQVQAARNHLRAVDESSGTVETSDEATQVFTDAEGTGGQGRELEEETEESTESAADGDAEDRAAGEPGGQLDIRA
jgi:hypothetical protein